MNLLRNHTSTLELIFAAIGAAGLVLMVLFPVAGKIIVLVALAMAALCYVKCSISVFVLHDEDRFTRLLSVVNLATSAIVSAFLFIIILKQPLNHGFGIAAACLSLIAASLNLANKYIYQIKDENYISNQLRLLLLLALVVMFMVSGSAGL
jgi:hypothetical protein